MATKKEDEPLKETTNPKPSEQKPVEQKSKEDKEKERLPKYKKEQIERWISGINSLLTDEEGVKAFRKFLTEIKPQNDDLTKQLDFWCECQAYKETFCKLETSARQIYETYLEIGCDREVGTGSNNEAIETQLDEGLPGKNLFEEKQKVVQQKLDKGLYQNFLCFLKENYVF